MRRMSADWPTIVEQFRESGLSQAEFCRQRGLSLSSLGYWLKKRRDSGRSAVDARGPRFIELELMPNSRPSAAEATTAPARQADMVVELPFGVVMRFHGVAR